MLPCLTMSLKKMQVSPSLSKFLTTNIALGIELVMGYTDVPYQTTTNDLEKHVAEITGHESALFVLSGTMGNQLAMRSHLFRKLLLIYQAHVVVRRYTSSSRSVLLRDALSIIWFCIICSQSFLEPPHSILCDHRAHVLNWESGAAAVLSQALMKGRHTLCFT